MDETGTYPDVSRLNLANFVFIRVNKNMRVEIYSQKPTNRIAVRKIISRTSTFFNLTDCLGKQIQKYTELYNYYGNNCYFYILERNSTVITVYLFISKEKLEQFVNFLLYFRNTFYQYISFFKSNTKLRPHIIKETCPNFWSSTYSEEVQNISLPKIDIKKFNQEIKVTSLPVLNNNGHQVFLSVRQTEIVIALMKGMSFQEIEIEYNISAKTAEFYFYNVKVKTGYKTRNELFFAVINNNPWLLDEI